MNKNTICKTCGKHFIEGEGIHVIKTDEDETYHLCEKCFDLKCAEDAEFKAWYENDTRILDMDDDEIAEEFGGMGLEDRNLCSFWTTFEDDELEPIEN
jgi:hypothetical protein